MRARAVLSPRSRHGTVPVVLVLLAVGVLPATGQQPSASGVAASPRTFTDVDAGNVHAPGIAAVAEAGITTGCAPGRFCPGDAVTRAQMATFLARALELSAAGGAGFVDVDAGNVHAPGIAAVAEAGITTGCAPGRFCPGDAVTRAQMATFLARALELSAAGGVGFVDVDAGNVHAPGIAAVAEAGITTGCAPGRFCPGDAVTRAQMATFLARALLEEDLPAPDPPPAPDSVIDARERRTLAVGESHGCALTPAGAVVCWGEGSASQPPDGLRLATLSSGRFHLCGLEADGTVHCWGRNHSGESAPPDGLRLRALGLGDEKSCGITLEGELACWGYLPGDLSDPPAGSGFRAVAPGHAHACALTEAGQAVCWAQHPTRVAGDVPDQLPPLRAIAAGTHWSCAVSTIGDPVCWGESADVHEPQGNALAMVAGLHAHACGLRGDGTPVCWGSDASGQRHAPEGERFAFLDAGWNHTCGMTPAGTVRCWGRMLPEVDPPAVRFDATGPPAPPDPDPGPEVDVVDPTPITAGEQHTCLLDADGAPVCWGSGPAAQPPEYARLVTLTSGRSHVCGIEAQGAVHCWGDDVSRAASPPGLVRLQAIDAGHNHTCGVDLDGALVCWGVLAGGMVDVPGGSGWLSVAAGSSHSCALGTAGQLACWSQHPLDTEAAPPDGLPPLRQLVAGNSFTCGLSAGGDAVCWGRSSHVGADTELTGLARLAAGYAHVCGLQDDGTPVCAGSNTDGQLELPDELGALSAVAGGRYHTCGVRPTGAVSCWGRQGPASTPPASLLDPAG